MRKFWIEDLVEAVQKEFQNVIPFEVIELEKSGKEVADKYVIEFAVLEDPTGKRFHISHEWNPQNGHSFDISLAWFDYRHKMNVSLSRNTLPENITTDAMILWVWAGRIAHMMANEDVAHFVDAHLRKLVEGSDEVNSNVV